MQYLGGKARLAKHFAPLLTRALARGSGFLYEPFTGGFNVVPRLGDAPKGVLCGDLHPGLISLYRALQAGTWTPPETLSEAEFEWLKVERDWSNPLTAFAAFGCSFAAIEFGSYARNAMGTNYARNAARGLAKKARHMARVEFRHQDYEAGALDCDLNWPAVIYADPPYRGTAGYSVGEFDPVRFGRWCGAMAEGGHAVYVSEFSPPIGVRYETRMMLMRHRGLRSNAATHVADYVYQVLGLL